MEDIGGSRIENNLDVELKKSLTKDDMALPKEILYTDCMESWSNVAKNSNQTLEEEELDPSIMQRILKDFPNGASIVDMGAADSPKYKQFVKLFRSHGLSCSYYPVDVNKESLIKQVQRADEDFPDLEICLGLWGTFEDAYRYIPTIKGPILVLFMGSIFFNAPEELRMSRCKTMYRILKVADRVLISQEGPPETPEAERKICDNYGRPDYWKLIFEYVGAIHRHAGIETPAGTGSAAEMWEFDNRWSDKEERHDFPLVAKVRMACTKFNNFVIEAGKRYFAFPSWKPSNASCEGIAKSCGLQFEVLKKPGQKDHGRMRQFLLWK